MVAASLFVANLVLATLLTGLSWCIQVVHYPLMAEVGAAQFQRYHALHSTLISYVVVVPMLMELGLAWLLVWRRPPGVSLTLVLGCAALAVVVWLATFGLSVPLHARLAQGYDRAALTQLVTTNWVRTAAWSLRCGLLVYGLLRMLDRS